MKLDCCYRLTIEPDVFWRLGGPPDAPSARAGEQHERKEVISCWCCISLAAARCRRRSFDESPIGETAERHISDDQTFTRMGAGSGRARDAMRGDRVETREVVARGARNGQAQGSRPADPIRVRRRRHPAGIHRSLRTILDGMRERRERAVALGRARGRPAAVVRARARSTETTRTVPRACRRGGGVSFKRRSSLPPRGDLLRMGRRHAADRDAMPREQGRALNRRVEVEVWYDEVEADRRAGGVRRRRGHQARQSVPHRNRLQDALHGRSRAPCAHPKPRRAAALRATRRSKCPRRSSSRFAKRFDNLRDKQNVAVKFIGYTDNVPLTGRNERIYGDAPGACPRPERSASRWRSRRRLRLPTAAVQSEGRGVVQPLASNETAQGRALNRRIEVEFWYDDPLQELPDEPQLCPDAAGAEIVTKVYEPPWGRIAPLRLDAWASRDTAGIRGRLAPRAVGRCQPTKPMRGCASSATRPNERLDRRTALVYGDDIGLSAARARRAMETISRTDATGGRSRPSTRGAATCIPTTSSMPASFRARPRTSSSRSCTTSCRAG